MTNPQAAIETTALSKVYATHVGRPNIRSLDNLALRIEPKEVFGFLGRNGAGKTTTIKILCGLLRPTSGDAVIFGESVRRRQARRFIGYLPENPYFYEYLTPRETIEFYAKLHGLDAQQRSVEWDKLADLLDLGSIANQRVRGFSKGMRQRLGFAVALVGDPPLLILDEPMTGLDPLGRRQIRELILRLRDQDKTIFFSSHVLGDVEQICNRVGILAQGRLVRQGRIDELLARKVNEVEVIIQELPEDKLAALRQKALRHRRSEAGDHLSWPDRRAANSAIAEAVNAGAMVVEVSPLMESLEDYFMRNQEQEA